MKKALVLVLAVMLVMSMAVPAYAAGVSSPKAPETSETTTAAKPEVVADPAANADVVAELLAVEEVKELPVEVQQTVVAAQEALEEAAPEGMKTQYFCYFKVEPKDTTKTVEPVTLTVKIDNIQQVVVKQFVDGKWVELKAKLNADGTVTIEGLVDGPIAIFTK